MAKIETYSCDGCGKLKEEANHWWVAGVCDGGEWYIKGMKPGMTINEFERTYCGRACVLKAVERFMEEATKA